MPCSLKVVDASPTLKRRWAQAFEELVRFKLPIQLTDKYDRSFVSVSPVKQVARRLTFEEVVSDTDMQSAIPFCVAPSVATTKSGRGRMKRCGTPLVAPPVNFSSRRMTRSVAKMNGFKPISAVPIKPKPLRQPRSKKSKLDVDALVNATPTTENEKSEAQRHRRCHPLHQFVSCRALELHWVFLLRNFMWRSLWLIQVVLPMMSLPMTSKTLCCTIERHVPCDASYVSLLFYFCLLDLATLVISLYDDLLPCCYAVGLYCGFCYGFLNKYSLCKEI